MQGCRGAVSFVVELVRFTYIEGKIGDKGPGVVHNRLDRENRHYKHEVHCVIGNKQMQFSTCVDRSADNGEAGSLSFTIPLKISTLLRITMERRRDKFFFRRGYKKKVFRGRMRKGKTHNEGWWTPEGWTGIMGLEDMSRAPTGYLDYSPAINHYRRTGWRGSVGPRLPFSHRSLQMAPSRCILHRSAPTPFF